MLIDVLRTYSTSINIKFMIQFPQKYDNSKLAHK